MNKQKELIEKINYFFSNEIKCHVNTIPKGSFKNGRFASGLEEKKYFWFICSDGIPFRLFLNEIYSVEEYKEREVGK